MYQHTKKLGSTLVRSLNRTKSNFQIHSRFRHFKNRRSITSKHPAEKRVLQEREERASQLHSKLEDLMHKKSHDVVQQESRPMYKIFFGSLLKKKAEIINVGAALVCTLLAYQLVGLKIRSRKLEEKLKLRESELFEKQALLKSLTESAFLDDVSEKCNERLVTAPNGFTWNRSKKSQDTMPGVASILQQELLQRIGDAGLSEEEKKNRVVTKLQEARDELLMEAAASQQEKMMGTKQEDREVLSAPSREKVVKVTKFSI